MSDPLTDRLELYQLPPTGFETWVLISEFHDCPAAWVELIASWGTMAIIWHFQRLILQDGVDVQAFLGC
jgi:hypothetical protein